MDKHAEVRAEEDSYLPAALSARSCPTRITSNKADDPVRRAVSVLTMLLLSQHSEAYYYRRYMRAVFPPTLRGALKRRQALESVLRS